MIDESANAMLAAARDSFSTRRGQLQHVEVPEWPVGGKPGKVYFYPIANPGEWIAVRRHVNDVTGEVDPEIYITTLILFARDAKGNRLFGEHSRRDLMREFDPFVIERIVNRMGIFSRMEQEGLESGKPDSSSQTSTT